MFKSIHNRSETSERTKSKLQDIAIDEQRKNREWNLHCLQPKPPLDSRRPPDALMLRCSCWASDKVASSPARAIRRRKKRGNGIINLSSSRSLINHKRKSLTKILRTIRTEVTHRPWRLKPLMRHMMTWKCIFCFLLININVVRWLAGVRCNCNKRER